jgi:L-ascorbate metabolism protein UlaG (beta-lactamase superfamily)
MKVHMQHKMWILVIMLLVANLVTGCIDSEGKSFYYSGDTALTLDMQLIAERHNLNFAFLPIGNNFTMDVTDAITASKFIKCNHIIGMHYDTFGYIVVDHQEAVNQFNLSGKLLTLMNIGQTIDI